ncbi:hypothetical protein [Nonomuraea sp. NPDC052265]|uniref:hypothetical protein n=1 Tax=Nonomuraea sp. NPDC052265 TaxID=3364374 RepID=UPI0037CA932B
MDIPLLIVTLALASALVVLMVFVVLACGIRRADRRQDPFSDPRSEVEHAARSVLIYARRKEGPPRATPLPHQGTSRRR